MVFFFIGILLTQLLYVVTNYQQYRRNDYLRYALYISLFIVYFICIFPDEVILDKTIHDKFIPFADAIKRPLAFLLYLVYFRFMNIFLGLKEKYPELHRQVLISNWLIISIFFIQVVMLLAGVAYTDTGNIIYFGLSFFLFGVSVWFIAKAYRHKNLLTVTLLRGSICLSIGAFVTNVINIYCIVTGTWMGVVPHYLPFFAGILLELFFFNLALAYKIAQEETELAATQSLVIDQMQQNEQLILEQEQNRSKIARDLHDEVGATLSGITLFGELALHNIARKDLINIDGYLNRISKECTFMADKINDIVWTAKTENDTLEKLLNRLHSYARPMCSTQGIEFDFYMNERVAQSSLPTETRNNLYLFCKEAINNAIKYSGASKIDFSATGINDSVIIVINDNGRGFDPATVYEGNGLKNMNSRASDMTGDYHITSKKGSGTTVSLKLKSSLN